MRKLTSLLLSLLLVFALATTAFAAGEVGEPAPSAATSGTNDNSGKITINNAVEGQTYTIYQILKLESYNAAEGSEAYAYKATDAWKSFVESTGIKDVYLATDAQGYVTWVGENTDTRAQTFAKLAKAHVAENKSITSQGSETADSKTVTFTGLNLGYYLVDSTLGTLCSLDTTNPSVDIREKNVAPTNEKTVQEDSKVGQGDEWGKTNDAEIGQTVNFKSTITAQAGAENYVFHDKMSAGLTYTGVTGITLNNAEVDAKYYSVKTSDLSDECTFEVVFTKDFCDTLENDDKIVISYTAKLNGNAVVGLEGNPNESKLSYGDSSTTATNTTPPSTTTTYTWDMEVLKYANGKEADVLAGVKFVLIKKVTSGEITTEYVAKFDENKKLTDWVAVPAAGTDGKIDWPEGAVLTTDKDGKIEIKGLDSDTYYLREIEALPGYNILSTDKEFTIIGKTVKDEKDTYETLTVKVENNSGTELPSTGGMGTTIFYILGSALVLAAGVLLVTKKRMSAEN